MFYSTFLQGIGSREIEHVDFNGPWILKRQKSIGVFNAAHDPFLNLLLVATFEEEVKHSSGDIGNELT
jgi:hypothetical protein